MIRSAFFINLLLAIQLLAVQAPVSSPSLPAATPGILQILGLTSSTPVSWNPISATPRIATWQLYPHQNSNQLAAAFGQPVPLAAMNATESAIRNAALEFINLNRSKLGIGGSSATITAYRQVGHLLSITCQLELDNKPIECGNVVLVLNNRNELMSVKADGFGDQTRGAFQLDDAQAAAAGRDYLQPSTSVKSANQIYLPRLDSGETILQAAWKIEYTTASPAYQPTLFLDATDGTILAAENRVQFIDLSGNCAGGYFPLYHNQGESRVAYPYERVFIDDSAHYAEPDGSFDMEVDPENSPYLIYAPLDGRWADVQEWDADSSSMIAFEVEANGNTPLNADISWTDGNCTSDERNLYMQVTIIHDFYKVLEPDFDGLDYPMLSVCGMGGAGWEDYEDNAFSNAEGLFFGRGNQADNFALYADVIYHEYGHSVTGVVYRGGSLPYEEESGALNEGWSDYFTCSLTNESGIGEGGLVGNGMLRNINNNLVYPRDIDHEVHDDSRIVSAAMWHTREDLGQHFSDSLFHFSRYLHGNDFTKYLIDVLAYDDDNGDLSDGTPHHRTIFENFSRHGISIGDLPYYKIVDVIIEDNSVNGANGNDNGFVEPGETFALSLQYFRVWGARANNNPILVTMESSSPDLNGLNWEYNDSLVDVGDVSGMSTPFLTRVSPDAATGFAWLYFNIASGNDNSLRDSLRITIGIPPILVVRDGETGPDQSKYYRSSLDSLHVIYSDINKVSSFRPIDEIISLYSTVIWFTGNDTDNILDAGDVDVLDRYLDHGGQLIMSGQYIAKQESNAEFLANKLGVRFLSDSTTNRWAEGVVGDSLSNGLKVLLQGQVDAAGNQVKPPSIEPVGAGVGCFKWTRLAGQPAAAVRYEDPNGRYRSVFFAFGLEGISRTGNTNDRRTILDRTLKWLNTPLAVSENVAKPTSFALRSVYPNPFNSTVKISYNLESNSLVKLMLFDQSGRFVAKLEDGSQTAGTHEVIWDAVNAPSGVYLIRFEAGGKSFNHKMALIK